MDSDPEPKTKGEVRRQQIVKAIRRYWIKQNVYPTIPEIQKMTRIRSFNTLSNQLNILKQQGVIEWDQQNVRFPEMRQENELNS